MICNRYRIAIVPFPFVDIDFAKPRPALAPSSYGFNADCGQTNDMIARTVGALERADARRVDKTVKGILGAD
jgi:hypothetical protein